MNVAPVAYRYARSLMQLAIERGELPQVQEDMRMVANTCAGSRDLIVVLKSPVIKGDKKDRILELLFGGKVSAMTSSFMGIMVRKGREAMLPEVAEAFEEIRKVHDNVVTCVVTSAVPLDEEARNKVKAMASAEHPGKTIQLTEKVDPSLIGGVIVRIGDEQYDGSVSRRLNDLRRKFSENPYIPEI